MEWGFFFTDASSSPTHSYNNPKKKPNYTTAALKYKPIGRNFNEDHSSLWIWSLNMNTLKPHEDLTELHDL